MWWQLWPTSSLKCLTHVKPAPRLAAEGWGFKRTVGRGDSTSSSRPTLGPAWRKSLDLHHKSPAINSQIIKQWIAAIKSFIDVLIVGLYCAMMTKFLKRLAIECEYSWAVLWQTCHFRVVKDVVCEGCNLPITGDIWKPALQDFFHIATDNYPFLESN